MENGWRAIWNRRNVAEANPLDLKTLIELDGFDSGAGKIDIVDWREYARRVSVKLGLKDGDSVYEVGCGCGAFLFALNEQCRIEVGGNDYGFSLIETAKKVFHHGDFECIEAINIPLIKKYDYVISNSVFHYFDYDYAKSVLYKMLTKASKGVLVLEIPDLKFNMQAENLRRDVLSVDEYEKKYFGLKHTYYQRDWFLQIAEDLDLTCEIFDGLVPNYAQNAFRFGCLIRKR